MEAWPTTSKLHAVKLLQPRHSKQTKVKVATVEEVQAVAEETQVAHTMEQHLKAKRIRLVARELAAVEEHNLNTTLEQVEVDKEHRPQSWSRSARRGNTLEKEAQSRART